MSTGGYPCKHVLYSVQREKAGKEETDLLEYSTSRGVQPLPTTDKILEGGLLGR